MGTMIDAVDPANIPAAYNGGQVCRISTQGSPGANVYDLEAGNPGMDVVGPQLRACQDGGMAVIAYVNQSTCSQLVAYRGAYSLRLMGASLWPEPGVYLWLAAPNQGLNPAPSWSPVAPVAVQHTYTQGYDLSVTAPRFPGTVAGYMDGPVSRWPSSAWSRFRPLVCRPSVVTPGAGSAPKVSHGGRRMQFLFEISKSDGGKGEVFLYDAGHKVPVGQGADVAVWQSQLKLWGGTGDIQTFSAAQVADLPSVS